MRTNLEDGHNIWMVQFRGRFRLGMEPPDLFLTRQLPRQDHFQRDDAFERHLSRPVHHAHAAACNFFQQFVFTKVAHGSTDPRWQRHVGHQGWRVSGDGLPCDFHGVTHWGRQLGDLVVVGQKLGQFVGQCRELGR